MKKKLVAIGMSALLISGLGHQVNAQTKEFKDVGPSYWAYNEIMKMREKGIITGYSDNTFKPNNAIRRDHVAVLLARSMKLPVVEPATKFKDVPDNYLYANEIRKVQQANIFDGDADGKFRPTEYLTRAQMAKVLTRAFNLQKKANYDFPDTDKHWAKEYVRALYSNGITFGSGGYFKPEEKVTRAQYATFLYRALNMNPDFKPAPIPNDPTPPNKVETIIDENKDLFDKSIEVADYANENPLLVKMLTEGLTFVKKTNLKFYGRIDSTLYLKNPNYRPVKKQMPYELYYYDENGKTFFIRYDFRSDAAHYLAKEWMKLSAPALAQLESKIDEKVQEARTAEKNGEYFPGNGEFVTVGNYKVRLGVNNFLESMSIEAEYIGQ
ncbi:S-layer homology domain-containing protein [Parageobacillus thermoglucosidasius]|uniref:S-layer homology domain-containing protein n=1 Tax=Parageobacillus thermoglucosidasius TaxID=1426 RepID=A0AB38R571_PARTM|nr:S-layer homology domain-containing protein [Parageobacillus thermoglucosidasius]UOE78383.1 S-layer homology domain-containing protein [Parageobacillus thermoglucosidasius]